MARPINCRRVSSIPECRCFRLRGTPFSMLEEVSLTFDEFEAIGLLILRVHTRSRHQKK